MSDFITDYGEQLRRAGWRRMQRRRRLLGGRLPRRLIVSLAVLAVAAPAVAQSGVWRPLLGDGRGPAPTTSSQPAAERQRAILSVLRREQRAADRGPQTAYALRFLAPSVSDVHTTSIRLLHVEPDGRGIVLIPVGRRNIPTGASPTMPRVLEQRLFGPDRLCLFAADQEGGRPAGGGFGCYSTAQLLAGRASAGLGARVYGLVPDGVARLELLTPGRPSRTVEVHENFFIYDGALGRDTVRWIAPDGRAIKTLAGKPTLLAPPSEPDPTTSLCDPKVPPAQCASERYSSPHHRGR